MKIFTPIRTFALVAGILLSTQLSMAKATKPTSGGQIVISKIFANMMKNDADKAYAPACYIQLFNNSTDTLDIAGMYLGLAESYEDDRAWTAAAMAQEHKDSVALKQIFQFPTDKEYRVNPGQSIVITNCAYNHTLVAAKAPDLTNADFEVKTTNNAYKDYHNDNVPAMTVAFTYASSADYISFKTYGPCAIVLLAHNTPLDKCSTGFERGKTDGSTVMFVPNYKMLDAIDVVIHSKQKSPSAADKRIYDSYDKGFIAQATPGGNNGEAIVRKTAFVTSAGRTVLFDTDNSSVDCESTEDLSIRSYNQEPAGLDETMSITIPESGYLAFNPSKPFCGPKGMVFAHVSASNNESTTDLIYSEFPADSILLIKGPWIAIAEPGTYTLKLSDSQGVMKSRSSSTSWCDDNELQLSGSKASNVIYKFSNVKRKVGFKRVDAVGGKYNKATFSDGDRMYIALSDKNIEKIYAANGASSKENLDFITWHGTTPEEIAAGIDERVVTKKDTPADNVFYNLSGQRVEHPTKGIYIKNGVKVVMK